MLVALPLLAVWLGDSFPAAMWAAPVAGLLLIVAKVVEVLKAAGDAAQPAGPSFEAAGEPAKPKPSLWWG